MLYTVIPTSSWLFHQIIFSSIQISSHHYVLAKYITKYLLILFYNLKLHRWPSDHVDVTLTCYVYKIKKEDNYLTYSIMCLSSPLSPLTLPQDVPGEHCCAEQSWCRKPIKGSHTKFLCILMLPRITLQRIVSWYMMRKFNIKIFYTNFLCAEKFVDLTLQACRMIHVHLPKLN